MTKYALLGLIAVCITALCFSLVMRDRLCGISISQGGTVIQATLAYEARK